MLMTRAYHRANGEGEQRRKVPRARLGARHEPRNGHDGRLRDGDDPIQRAWRDRPRGAAARRSVRTCGAHDHEPRRRSASSRTRSTRSSRR
jgi:hypothetical protein